MATEHSAEVTQAISRFEAAWADGANPQLKDFIPPATDDNVELVAELVAVDLERRLKAGESIRVEKYLQQFPKLVDAQKQVVDLLVDEFQHRRRSNPALAVDEYLERFPQFRAQLLARLVAFDETLIDSERVTTRTIASTSSAAVDKTVDGLLRRMVELGLVSDAAIETRRKSLPAGAQQNQHLIDELLERGNVTRWQLKQLRAGQKTFLLENGRYLLLDELGKGGMGAVYRARHVGLNREVALKTIDPKQAKNSQLIARFQREIAVCAKLQHEHIVQAYDMGCHQGVHFLVLEYVQGADLASLIKRDGPMWPEEVAAVGLQIAAALAYAHAEGIVHRDIKPHNILLSSDGIAKLLDLGLASNNANDGDNDALTSLTQTGMVLGTVDYMPPEQAADLAKVDGRSDIYSLGATLYYLLTGRPPFPGGDMMNKMHRLANEEPAAIGQLRPDCPRELTDVVERMLAKQPEERYQSAVEVVQALQPLAAERIAGRHVMTRAVHTAAEADTGTPYTATVAVTPFALASDETVATSMLRRKPRRTAKKWWVGGAAALLLLVLSFGVIAWSLNSGDTGGASPSISESVPVAAVPRPLDVRDELPGHYSSGSTRPTVLAISPDGTRLATGASDGRVFVWDIELKKPIRCYRGHDSAIVGVCWSSDGNLIASRDQRGGTIDVWHAGSGMRRARTETIDLSNQTSAMAFAPKEKVLAYASPGATNNVSRQDVWIWKFDSDKQTFVGKEEPVRGYHPKLRFSSDGAYLASWKPAAPLNVYNLESGSLLFRHTERQESVHRDIGFLPDGRVVVVTDRDAQFLNSNKGTPVETRPLPEELLPSKPSEVFRELAVSADGRQLLTWVDNRKARLFNLTTWKVDSTSRTSVLVRNLQGRQFSPDLRYAAFLGESWIACAAVADPAQWTELNVFVNLEFGGGDAPLAQPILLGGRYLKAGHTGGCWDIQTGSQFFQFPDNAHVRPDGSIDAIVVSTNAGSARILRYASGDAVRDGKFDVLAELTQPQHYVHNIQWRANGELVYGETKDHTRIRFWNAETGEIARTVELSAPSSHFVHVNRSGDILIASEGNVVIRTLGVYSSGEKLGTINAPSGTSFSTFDLAGLTPQGDRFVTEMRSPRRDIMMWDTQSQSLRWELNIEESDLPRHQFLKIRLSESGRWFAASDFVYDTDTGERLWRCPERTRATSPPTGCFCPNEDFIVLPVDHRYQIWNWKTNKKVFSLYVLPDQNWAMVDSELNFTGTRIAPQYLRLLHRDKTGKETWLKPTRFEKQTGWKNEAEKVRFIMPPADTNKSR